MTRVNISFQNVQIFVTAMESIGNDDVCNKLRIGATKARDLCVDVIAKYGKIKLAEILKTNYFFISVDEATDVRKKKRLVIVTRYTDDKTGKKKNSLWKLVNLLNKDEKAKLGSLEIKEAIKKSFLKSEIPLSNIIGMSFKTY